MQSTMNIPLVDLVAQYEQLRDEVLPAMEEVLSRAHFVLGEEVELFEDEFAAFCEADHCIGVASGTDALHLALRALDVGPGDEVITAANTFAATAFAVLHTGASPVFVDVTRRDHNIDVGLIERAITERTKVIVPRRRRRRGHQRCGFGRKDTFDVQLRTARQE
ncbi:MAG: aminotransferase class I/II-fold pyridoxal phosphate-dependent enzyme [Planctomycetota bacterium]|jgi:dTDP-4-amino-4,6-dideoxygalactose transaminase